MKIQIKTLNQKTLVIDIAETKTVYDLKKELSLYAEVGVKPELQKIIYAGQVLANEEQLGTYNIDVNKSLVVMIIQQPVEELAQATQKLQQEPVKIEKKETKVKVQETAKLKSPTEPKDLQKELVNRIVAMGYPETDVRRALIASFYNPERAIQYLIEGIPTSPSTPEGASSSSSGSGRAKALSDIFRDSSMFQKMIKMIHADPGMLDRIIAKLGRKKPGLLAAMLQHSQDFVDLLVDGRDDEDEDGNIELSEDEDD